jgi:hypothetical protein
MRSILRSRSCSTGRPVAIAAKNGAKSATRFPIRNATLNCELIHASAPPAFESPEPIRTLPPTMPIASSA